MKIKHKQTKLKYNETDLQKKWCPKAKKKPKGITQRISKLSVINANIIALFLFMH